MGAKSVCVLEKEENFNKRNFPDVDNDGFEIHVPDGTSSIAEIEYNFFREIYFEYNQGHDEFHDQEEQLKIDLMEANGINEEFIENLREKLQKVTKENKSLKED